MTKRVWAALAALVLLAGCGAEDPPSAPGGMPLDRVWRGSV